MGPLSREIVETSRPFSLVIGPASELVRISCDEVRKKLKALEKRLNPPRRRAQTPFPPGISQPALRALAAAGHTHLEQLADTREKDLLALHGMGPKAIRILGEALAGIGRSFAGPGEPAS